MKKPWYVKEYNFDGTSGIELEINGILCNVVVRRWAVPIFCIATMIRMTKKGDAGFLDWLMLPDSIYQAYKDKWGK